jgi:hypothetical protein
MLMKTKARTEGNTTALLSASHKFKGFKPEIEREMRVPEIKIDKTQTHFIRAWKLAGFDSGLEGYISVVESLLGGVRWSAKDVTAFSIYMVRLQNDVDFLTKSGLFLSVLMERSQDKEFEIYTRHLTVLPAYIGYTNKKVIVVHGDVGPNAGFRAMRGRMTIEWNTGNGCGEKMHGGEIIIKGSSGKHLGSFMTGGDIVVNGNSGDLVGANMKKYYVNVPPPTIFVKGNAGRAVGEHMAGGEIRIDGDFASLGDVESGKIFHKGQLIADK